MRSNGLRAAAYAPVADLDPRTADAMLEQLKGYGIAAYSTPVERSATAGFERPDLGVDLQDRLYVDAAATDEARRVLGEIDADALTGNDDLAWAQIVAGYDRPVDVPVAPWPVDEDVSETDDDSGDFDEAAGGDGRSNAVADDTEPVRWWQRSRFDDDDFEPLEMDDDTDDVDDVPEADRFVPPTPPPLPRPSGRQQLAWLGVAGGPVLLLVAALFGLGLPTWLTLIAAGAFIGGFIALVAMMDNHRDPWDPDDGAQV